MRMRLLAAAVLVGLPSSLAQATANATYSYDALGRLVTSCQTPPTGAYRTDYSLDRAGNRQNLTSQNEDISMPSGTSIYSPDGTHHLAMQGDGNLVLYSAGTAIWATNTAGSGAIRAHMQGDGNLVLYTSSATAVWSSHTSGHYCASMAVQNDGNLVIYGTDNSVLWMSNTAGQ